MDAVIELDDVPSRRDFDSKLADRVGPHVRGASVDGSAPPRVERLSQHHLLAVAKLHLGPPGAESARLEPA